MLRYLLQGEQACWAAAFMQSSGMDLICAGRWRRQSAVSFVRQRSVVRLYSLGKLWLFTVTAYMHSHTSLCSAGFQELVRSLRCRVSPVNSVIAGGTAGYLLTALHSEFAFAPAAHNI